MKFCCYFDATENVINIFITKELRNNQIWSNFKQIKTRRFLKQFPVPISRKRKFPNESDDSFKSEKNKWRLVRFFSTLRPTNSINHLISRDCIIFSFLFFFPPPSSLRKPNRFTRCSVDAIRGSNIRGEARIRVIYDPENNHRIFQAREKEISRWFKSRNIYIYIRMYT